MEISDELLDRIRAGMKEIDRLRGLDNKQLVRECLNTDAADYAVVLEMMHRLYPGWEEEEIEGEMP